MVGRMCMCGGVYMVWWGYVITGLYGRAYVHVWGRVYGMVGICYNCVVW